MTDQPTNPQPQENPPVEIKTGILDIPTNDIPQEVLEDQATTLVEENPPVEINYDISAWQKDGIIPQGIDLEDPTIQYAVNSFKDANLTEEQAQKFITSYLKNANDSIKKVVTSFEEEALKVFGSEQQMKAAAQTIQDFHSKMSPDEANTLKEAINFNPKLAKLVATLVKPPKINNVIPNNINGVNSGEAVKYTAQDAWNEANEYREKMRLSGRLYTLEAMEHVNNIWRKVK